MKLQELRETQKKLYTWKQRNFPNSGAYEQCVGLIEELGELAHAHLKGSQNIRHTPAEIVAMKQDAIGDMVVFLLNLMSDLDCKVGLEDDCNGVQNTHFRLLLDLSETVGLISTELNRPNPSSCLMWCHHLIKELGIYCISEGLDFDDCVNGAVEITLARNWVRFPKNGKSE